MGVIVDRQAKVALVLGARMLHHILAGAEGLEHGQRQFGKMVRVGLFAPRQEFIQRLGVGRVGQLGAQRRGQGLDAVPPLGSADNPAQAERVARPQKPRHGHVGRDHEAFNDIARGVFRLGGEPLNSIVDYYGNILHAAQRQGPVLFAKRFQPPAGLLLQEQLLAQGRRRGGGGSLQPGGDLVVIQARLVAHHRRLDIRACHRPVLPHHHLHDQRPPVHVRTQGSHVRGKPLRQHGKHRAAGIDRGRVGAGLHVGRGSAANHGIDIGYAD